MNRVQVDEIGLILKKRKHLQANDSDELGDIYTLTALKTETRLFLSHHEFRVIELRRSILVFTSDNWDAFEEGLVNIYGYLENPPYKGTWRGTDAICRRCLDKLLEIEI